MNNKPTIARLRKICMALPGAAEVEAWTHPTFRIRNKIFCVFGGYENEPNITLKVGKPALGIFLEDPRYWKASHIGNQGWISMSAKAELNWEEIEELVKGSYALVALNAPKSKSSPPAPKSKPAKSNAAKSKSAPTAAKSAVRKRPKK
jgi:predicted DNA-binding protein (MmcQ/YjbR family)